MIFVMYYFLHCCKGSTLSSYYDKVHIKAPHPKGGTLVFFSKFYTPILALCSLGDVTISTLSQLNWINVETEIRRFISSIHRLPLN